MRRYISIFVLLIGSVLCVTAQKTFTLVIDAGHGGKDPGASGAISKEKNINLAVAKKLGAMIEDNHSDVQVVYTRKNDVFVELDERANIANRYKADLFISIHVNSSKKSKSASGAETYSIGLSNSDENLEVAKRENSVIMMEDNYLQKYEGFDPQSSESYIIFEFMQSKHMEQSVKLASEIQRYFVRAKRKNRGVRQAGFLVLRKTSMPSVLVEVGFISNRNEERFMASKDGQQTLARAIYRAFCNYKSEYDSKSGNITDKRVITPIEAERNKRREEANKTTEHRKEKEQKILQGKNGVTYRVQIMTSDKKYKPTDKRFKGYKNISYYIENKIYKYTYGDTPSFDEANKLYKKALKDFKGAFIITMKNGERIK